MKYDVSVLVPVYNVSKFIERCLHTLFGQTYDNVQYIFVNDCTPDQSIEIIQKVLNKYPQRKEHVKIINHDKNRGLAAARNTGIENAGGEYVLHIDSDDYIELDMVELMFGKAKEEDADIVVCDFNIKWKKTQKIASQHFTDKDQYLRDILNTKAMPGVVNKLIRKSLYSENEIFPFEGINLGEDYVTTPKLIAKARRISKVNKPLYHYIQYNEGSYTAVMNQKAIDDLWFVLNELYNYFKSTKEFSLLKNDLLKGQLIKKLNVVGRVNNEKRREIFETFSEANTVASEADLSFRQAITYKLCASNQYQLLNLFLSTFDKFFRLVQKLKGR